MVAAPVFAGVFVVPVVLADMAYMANKSLSNAAIKRKTWKIASGNT